MVVRLREVEAINKSEKYPLDGRKTIVIYDPRVKWHMKMRFGNVNWSLSLPMPERLSQLQVYVDYVIIEPFACLHLDRHNALA